MKRPICFGAPAGGPRSPDVADIEVFLDETPGETRGVIVRNGRFTHLILHRDSDRPSDRLGARCVGRIARVEAGLRGAFVTWRRRADR